MFRIVLLCVLCYNTLSHPVTEPNKQPRQIECCPCPKDVGEEAMVASSQRAAGGLDDCPCRLRGADSEGSSSVFFPTAVRPDRPLLRSSESNPKEDPKNLLKPEVALATSVLDTLREATEEEYQNALARDAQRSASETYDAVPEESARNVVIIVNPKESDTNYDDFIPEASQVQESRCIHPLESSIGKLRSSESIKRPGMFQRNLLGNDNSVGASNLKESIIDFNGISPHKYLTKSITPLKSTQKTLSDDKSGEVENIMTPFKLKNLFRKSINDLKDHSAVLSNGKQVSSDGVNEKLEKLIGHSNSPLSLRNLLKLRDVEILPKLGNKNLLKDLLKPSILKITPSNNYSKGNLDSDTQNLSKVNEITSDNNVINDIKNLFDECVTNDSSNSDLLQKSPQTQNLGLKNIEDKREKILQLVPNNSAENESTPNSSNELRFNENEAIDDQFSETDVDTVGSPSKINENAVVEPPVQNRNSEISSEEPCNNNFYETEVLSKSGEPTHISEQLLSNVDVIPTIGDSLKNIRKSLVNGLQIDKPTSNFKSPSVQINGKDINLRTTKNEKSSSFEQIPATAKSSSSNAISTNDLQDMSDRLLLAVPNVLGDSHDPDCFDKNETKTDTSLRNFDDNSDSTSNTDTTGGRKDKQEAENACLDNKLTNTAKSAEKIQNNDKESNEMDTGASENVISMIPKTLDSLTSNLKSKKLFEGDIFKPVNDPLKMFETPLRDSLNSNTNLLSLEKLKERLANIFPDHPKNIFMPEQKERDAPIEAMVPESSVSNPRLKLPNLSPFSEDFGVNKFKNKPSTSIDSLLKVPKINLHSHRMKIPLPNNLDPTSNKLTTKRKNAKESGLLGSGTDRKAGMRTTKPSTDTFPSLEDIGNKIRLNTKNLLDRSAHPDLNIFKENSRSSNLDSIADTIHQNTQRTMQEFQHKMKSSLRKTKTSNSLGDRYAKPQELLDDVNDKLEAIHYDFNDRLESIRNSIMDTSKFRPLQHEPLKLASRNFMTDLLPTKARAQPARLQTSASNISTQKTKPDKTVERLDDLKLRATDNNSWQKPYRTQSIDDITIPSTLDIDSNIKNPSLPNLTKSPLLKHDFKLPTISKDLSSLAKQLRKDRLESLKTASTPSYPDHRKTNKVTITFGSTTAKPISVPQSNVPTAFKYYKEEPRNFLNSETIRGRGSEKEKMHSVSDHQLLPSENYLYKSTAPLKLSEEDTYEEFDDSLPISRNYFKNSNNPFNMYKDSSTFKTQKRNGNEPKTTKYFENSERFNIRSSSEILKNDENPFLAKLRDSVNNRLNAGSKNDRNNGKSDSTPQLDMLRAASSDFNSFGTESLKENVSYRCRMVCTREPT